MTLLFEDAARAALRARQGKGARYDAPNAPAKNLLLARRGTSYFARKLNELSDYQLNKDIEVFYGTRKHLIIFVSYHARSLALTLQALREKREAPPLLTSSQELWDQVELAISLPPRALRHLFTHTDVHLNVEWRDLPNAGWSQTILGLSGEPIRIVDLPLKRAELIWEAALALNNGFNSKDVPHELRATLPLLKGPCWGNGPNVPNNLQ